MSSVPVSLDRVRGLVSYQGIELWRHAVVVRWTLQIVSALVVVALVAWFFANIADAVQNREIPHGWGFLDRAYGTPMGQHFLPYESSDTFAYGLGVAAVNTAVVSVVAMVLATVLGVALAGARLSGNWVLARLAGLYVVTFRNVPLLVQLFFWFYVVLTLPPVREGYVLGGGLFVNNGGISLPFPSASDAGSVLVWLALSALAVVSGYGVFRVLLDRELRTGQSSYPVCFGVLAAVAAGASAWFAVSLVGGNTPFVLSFPEPLGRFGHIEGGFTAPGGLVVLLAGLSLYAAAFISDVVRPAVLSVSRGQVDSARALGLGWFQTARHIAAPQVVRSVFRPLLGQFLNLVKNSSLAGAVGYADLTNVGKTMTQTAPVVSVFLLVMAVYLSVSLVCSLLGHFYDRRMRWSVPLVVDSWRVPPAADGLGVLSWVRVNLFSSWASAFLAFLVSAVVVYLLFQGLRWVFTAGDWSIVGVLGGQLVIGKYNSDFACPGEGCFWRPQAVLLLFCALLGMAWGLSGSAVVRRLALLAVGIVALFALLPYGLDRMGWPVRLLLAGAVPALFAGWAVARFTGLGVRGAVGFGLVVLVLSVLLIRGLNGVPGLQPVAANHWGGLMVNLLLVVSGFLLSFPAGVALALGRRGDLPVLRLICVVFIEVFRGIPLLTMLFVSQVLVPLAFPEDFPINTLFRAGIIITLYSSAYMADNIAAGLALVPADQGEGARALGLPAWKATLFVSLPQALLRVIPSISSQFVDLFKDTTLIFVIGILDVLEVSRVFMQGNSGYADNAKELLLFLALVFWMFTCGLSYVTRKLDEGVGLRQG